MFHMVNRQTHKYRSLIDHVYVKKNLMDEFFVNKTVVNTYFSDHDAIIMIIEENAVDFRTIL